MKSTWMRGVTRSGHGFFLALGVLVLFMGALVLAGGDPLFAAVWITLGVGLLVRQTRVGKRPSIQGAVASIGWLRLSALLLLIVAVRQLLM